jgi:hypothetical protein
VRGRRGCRGRSWKGRRGASGRGEARGGDGWAEWWPEEVGAGRSSQPRKAVGAGSDGLRGGVMA